METLAPVVVEVVERVEEVEAGDPEQHRAAEHPRLPRSLAGDGEPGADRSEPEARAEPEVAEPRESLEVRVDEEHRDRDRPEPAYDRVELEDRHQEDRERTQRSGRPPATRVSAPLGSSRDAVRGFRASSSASRSRFSAIASVRAPVIATVIQIMSAQPGQPSTARSAPA